MSPDDREHLENVYAKLGVHTRTAAAALVGEENDDALPTKPRAVAGTVPGALRRIPVDVATQVGAERRQRVQAPAVVAVGGCLPPAEPQ